MAAGTFLIVFNLENIANHYMQLYEPLKERVVQRMTREKKAVGRARG
jgi:hypothetical protein